jgi:hypothetical protein
LLKAYCPKLHCAIFEIRLVRLHGTHRAKPGVATALRISETDKQRKHNKTNSAFHLMIVSGFRFPKIQKIRTIIKWAYRT